MSLSMSKAAATPAAAQSQIDLRTGLTLLRESEVATTKASLFGVMIQI
jgi:hypothetical protein